MAKLTVIDFFCGAGGFSEGFKQQGFEILKGYDYWKPAVDTYNHNFGTSKGVLQNILDFADSIDLIESLPDSDVILGSPPCVSFSSSNNSGNADKSLGLKLITTFLRIVAVKKHKPDSILKAWYMENVTKSIGHLKEHYTFIELNLGDWAKKYKIKPKSIAISLKGNHTIINSADYGSPQARKRAISGETILFNKLIIPNKTNKPSGEVGELEIYRTVSSIRKKIPSPNSERNNLLIYDPLYPNISVKQNQITDHFYDTGLYESEWRQSRILKVNHPFMGGMSFPENLDKPSRTITATKIGASREAIIYKSEHNRLGNGEFRTPTVREAAVLMSFPITFQFVGSEGAKWRLVGNAVCPCVSRTLAKRLRRDLKYPKVTNLILNHETNIEFKTNLNTYKQKNFNNPPMKNKGSRCRIQPFKDGNLTITLSNYDISINEKQAGLWRSSIQYGNGKGFPCDSIPEDYFKEIEDLIRDLDRGPEFIKIMKNGFSEKIADKLLMQKMFEEQRSEAPFVEPITLIEELGSIIEGIGVDKEIFQQKDFKIFRKDLIPKKQLFALYGINRIVTIANNK